MHQLYQTIGSGDLKANVNDAFRLAEKGPVVVLSRTQPKAVMVSPDEWNRTAQRLEELEGFFQAMEISARMDAEGDEGITHTELCKKLGIAERPKTTS